MLREEGIGSFYNSLTPRLVSDCLFFTVSLCLTAPVLNNPLAQMEQFHAFNYTTISSKVFFLICSSLLFFSDQCRAPGWHSVCGACVLAAILVRCVDKLLHCIHSCTFHMPNSQAYEFIKRSLAEGAMSNKDIVIIEEQERIGEAGSA